VRNLEWPGSIAGNLMESELQKRFVLRCEEPVF